MSIRRKLTLLMLLIGLLPTLAVSMAAYVTISDALTRKTVDQLVGTVTQQEQRLDDALQTHQKEAVNLASTYNLQDALGQYVASDGAIGQELLNALLQREKTGVPSMQAIQLVDMRGNVVATTVSGEEGKQLDTQDFKLAESQQIATMIRQDPRDNVNKLYITTPVSIDKRQAAYLRITFFMNDLVAIVQDYSGLGASGETVVVWRDRIGNAMSLFPLRFDTDAALKAQLNSLELVDATNTQPRTLTDYRGRDVLVAAKPVAAADWAIGVKIDLQEALAPIDQLRNALLGVATVFSVLVGAIALYFTHLITKPVLRITKAAQQIGKGDFSTRINSRRSDEIGVLAENIDRMGASLKELVAGIETQRRRLEVILNNTTESIIAVDKQGVIVTVNQATTVFTKLAEADIVGRPIQAIFSWRRNDESVEIDYNQPKTHGDLQYLDKTKTLHYAKMIVAQATNEPDQHAAQTIVTIYDETKDRELEAMKVDFVSMAAHELRTPLAAIRGYIELLRFKAGPNPPKETEQYLKQALGSTGELTALINNLLDVSRIERGTLTLSLEKIDLAASSKHIIQQARFSAEDKQLTLTYSGPAEDAYVIGDQIALHEVISNLVSNAIKYTPRGGTVQVSCTQTADACVVCVKDTGIGIPKAAQPNLFSKFYRVQGGLNSGNTGTGLGLFIAKSIVERLGGSIGFTSEEGAGSSFSFSLPLFDEQKFATMQADPQRKSESTKRRHGWITKNIAR